MIFHSSGRIIKDLEINKYSEGEKNNSCSDNKIFVCITLTKDNTYKDWILLEGMDYIILV